MASSRAASPLASAVDTCAHKGLAFTRYYYYHYCMVYGIQKGGRRGGRILTNSRAIHKSFKLNEYLVKAYTGGWVRDEQALVCLSNRETGHGLFARSLAPRLRSRHLGTQAVESRIRPNGGFGETPGKLLTLSTLNPYPKSLRTPAQKLRNISNL